MFSDVESPIRMGQFTPPDQDQQRLHGTLPIEHTEDDQDEDSSNETILQYPTVSQVIDNLPNTHPNIREINCQKDLQKALSDLSAAQLSVGKMQIDLTESRKEIEKLSKEAEATKTELKSIRQNRPNQEQDLPNANLNLKEIDYHKDLQTALSDLSTAQLSVGKMQIDLTESRKEIEKLL